MACYLHDFPGFVTFSRKMSLSLASIADYFLAASRISCRLTFLSQELPPSSVWEFSRRAVKIGMFLLASSRDNSADRLNFESKVSKIFIIMDGVADHIVCVSNLLGHVFYNTVTVLQFVHYTGLSINLI